MFEVSFAVLRREVLRRLFQKIGRRKLGLYSNAWHVAVVKANGTYFAFVIGHTRTLPQYEMMQSRMLNAAINSREADNNGKVEIGEFDGIFNANLPVNFM